VREFFFFFVCQGGGESTRLDSTHSSAYFHDALFPFMILHTYRLPVHVLHFISIQCDTAFLRFIFTSTSMFFFTFIMSLVLLRFLFSVFFVLEFGFGFFLAFFETDYT
jgi:hypothetical protein